METSTPGDVVESEQKAAAVNDTVNKACNIEGPETVNEPSSERQSSHSPSVGNETSNVITDTKDTLVNSVECATSSVGSVENKVDDSNTKSVETVAKTPVNSNDSNPKSVHDWAKIKSIDTNSSDDTSFDDLLDTDIVEISLKYGSNDTPDSFNTDDPDKSYKEMSPNDTISDESVDKVDKMNSEKKGLDRLSNLRKPFSRSFSESYIEDQINEADKAIDNLLSRYKRDFVQNSHLSDFKNANSFKRLNSENDAVFRKRIKLEHDDKSVLNEANPPIAIIEPFDMAKQSITTSQIIEQIEASSCSISKNKDDPNCDEEKQNIRSILDEMDSKISDLSGDLFEKTKVKETFQTSDGNNWTFKGGKPQTNKANAGVAHMQKKLNEPAPNVNPFTEFETLLDSMLDERSEGKGGVRGMENVSKSVTPVQSMASPVSVSTSSSVTFSTANQGAEVYQQFNRPVSQEAPMASPHFQTNAPSSSAGVTDGRTHNERPPSLGNIPNYQNPMAVSRDSFGQFVSQGSQPTSYGNYSNPGMFSPSMSSPNTVLTSEQERRMALAEQHRARVNMHYTNQGTPLGDLYSMVRQEGSNPMQPRGTTPQQMPPSYQGAVRQGMGGSAMGNMYSAGNRPVSPGYSHGVPTPDQYMQSGKNVAGMIRHPYNQSTAGQNQMGPQYRHQAQANNWQNQNYQDMNMTQTMQMRLAQQQGSMGQRMPFPGKPNNTMQSMQRFQVNRHPMMNPVERNMQYAMNENGQMSNPAARVPGQGMAASRMETQMMEQNMPNAYGRQHMSNAYNQSGSNPTSGRTMMTDPASGRPMMADPTSGRPMMADPASGRPMMAGMDQNAGYMMRGQQGTMVQNPHTQINRVPGQGMNVPGSNIPQNYQAMRQSMAGAQVQYGEMSGQGPNTNNYYTGQRSGGQSIQPNVDSKLVANNQSLIGILNQKQGMNTTVPGQTSSQNPNIIDAFQTAQLRSDATFGDLL